MLDLDDERISSLADVITNKTSKKIIEYLAEKEANETEISRDLNIPANTVNYNIKKLLKAGLIEKTKGFFWSVKGKRIISYRVANKRIVISPKSLSGIKQMILTVGIVGIISYAIKYYFVNNTWGVVDTKKDFTLKSIEKAADTVSGEGASMIEASSNIGEAIAQVPQIPEVWTWFFIGGLTALMTYILIRRLFNE